MASALLGYRSGFVRVMILLIQVMAPAVTALLLFKVLGRWIGDNTELAASLVLPVTFFSIFVVVFLLLAFLFYHLFKNDWNKEKLINKIAGAATGICMVCVALLSLGHFTNVVAIPQPVEAIISKSNINYWLDAANNYIDHETTLVDETPAIQVMYAGNDTVSHDAVILPFVTSDIHFKNDLETQMLNLVNAERKKNGLKILQYDEALTIAARQHSADMFRRGYFSHNNPEGLDPFQRLHKAHIRYRYAGENLALAPTLLKAHEELMKSPGHRANILNPAYGRIGIGIAAGGTHGLMVTQEFRD